MNAEIRPAPTDDEAVAITAAVDAMWPVPVIVTEGTQTRDTVWKFSGRWWNRPIPTRRERPYR